MCIRDRDILDNAERALPFIEKSFGGYPYKQFSFIDGGDGGMEYPMATLLAAPSAWLHEWLHNWYYGMLGTNESEYALSLIHISEPTRLLSISYAVFCLKK